jgi:hypothetical protein
MELVEDKAQLEACVGQFGDSANPSARKAHGLHQIYHKAHKSFWMHPMELLGYVGHVESRFSLFGDSISVSAR